MDKLWISRIGNGQNKCKNGSEDMNGNRENSIGENEIGDVEYGNEIHKPQCKNLLYACSFGKDSISCIPYLKGRIYAVHMYYANGMSFHKRAKRHLLETLNPIKYIEIPHYELSTLYRNGSACIKDDRIPHIEPCNLFPYIRKILNLPPDTWIVTGERRLDSIVRRAYIKGEYDYKRHIWRPLWNKTKNDILEIIKQHRLVLGDECKILGHSFRGLDKKDLPLIKQHFPADYARLKAKFPFIDALIL